MIFPMSPFESWTFEQLVQYNQAKILLAIPTGEFNQAVFNAGDLTLRWKAAQNTVRKVKS